MNIEIRQKFVDGVLKFFWWIDGEMVSPEEGLATVEDAEDWYVRSEYYKGADYIDRSVNRRWREIDRRAHRDRRDRVSNVDRRKKEQGRRWKDQLKKYR